MTNLYLDIPKENLMIEEDINMLAIPITISCEEDVSKFEKDMCKKGLLSGLLKDWTIKDNKFHINEYENSPSDIKTCVYGIKNIETYYVS
tara:strand:- start:16824 stop:17093 length:270 start_codon:yes stop_codon:yes gene_type:complete